MTKIWGVKVRGYYSVPYKIQGGKMTKNDHFRSIFSKVLVSYCPNLPKSQILSSSTCFSKFHVQKCSNFENWSQKWSKKPIFHKNAFFSKSLKIDLLLQKLSWKHEIWTSYAEPQGLQNVGSRFLIFFRDFAVFGQKSAILKEKRQYLRKKSKIQKSTSYNLQALWFCISGPNFMFLA